MKAAHELIYPLLLCIYLICFPSVGFSQGVRVICEKPGCHPYQLVSETYRLQTSLSNSTEAEELPTLCSGDFFQYQIFEPGINYWTWSLSPEWAIPVTQSTGPNGFQIISQLYNPTNLPLEITGVFIGYKIGVPDVLVKKINFWVRPRLACAIDQDISLDESNDVPGKVKFGMPKNNITDQSIENRSTAYTTSDLKVYPNPATNKIIVDWEQIVELPMKLFFFNSDGTKVREYEIADPNTYRREIDVSQCRAGIYFIHLVCGNQIHTGLLIKM